MRTRNLHLAVLSAMLSAMMLWAPIQPALSCSRAVYFGLEGQTVTGRSMDWLEDMQTNLWIFPRGMKHDGGMGEKGFKWTSKYGSVIASVYEAATADGMNERGFVANLLFLVALLSLLQATLTLPGIAGIILSLAVGVDAEAMTPEEYASSLRADAERYARAVSDTRLFLEGRNDELATALERRMMEAAGDLRFEVAERVLGLARVVADQALELDVDLAVVLET